MRISFVIPENNLTGGIRVVAIYAERLARRGHEVTVISRPRRQPTLGEKLKHTIRHGNWPRGRATNHSHINPQHYRLHMIDSYRPITNNDVPDGDVVIATWWETAEWVQAFGPKKGVPIYFVQHHETHPGQPIERVRATYRLPMKKIAVSQWIGEIMEKEYGDAETLIVPNSVDLELFHAPLRGKQRQPTIGLMYSTIPFKGVDVALQAINGARELLPDLAVCAFGTEEPAVRIPLPNGTRYWQNPPQDQLARIYAACDAWLFTSRMEGFGLPILEAMACRTPVIATRAGAAGDLLTQGGGFLHGIDDATAISQSIVQIAEMVDSQWRVVSDKAYQIASSYTWDDATTLFESALLANAPSLT